MSLRCGNIENGLRIGTDGKYYACCLAWSYPYKNEKGQILKADTTTFESALNSHSAKELRNALARGEKHTACKACWDAEEAGFESKRIRDTYHSDSANVKENELFFLELNLGNTCNLACRICGIHASSSWRKDFHFLNPELKDWEVNDRLKEYNKVFVDFSKLWDELDSTISQVRVLDLYGGEPMLMKKQWELLERCVEKGFSKYQHVHFNTNGTIFNEKYIEILKQFKAARISFSIDGVEEAFNYTRYPGKWDDIQKNIKSWLSLTKGIPNFSFEITHTISTLNVLDATGIGKWVLDHNLSTIKSGDHIITLYVAFVFAPQHLYIANIHDELKPMIAKKVREKAEKLKEHPVYKYHKYVYNEIIKIAQTLETSQNYDPERWKQFFFETERLDKHRKEDFTRTFPELAELLYQYKPNNNFVKII